MHNNNKNWDINSYHGCTKDKFRTDLLAFIKLCKNNRDKIVLMLDGNENMQIGKTAKALLQKIYNIIDSIRSKIGNLKSPTYHRGQE